MSTATARQLGADDLGTVITVHGREFRPPCPLGQPAEYSGELTGLTLLPGGPGIVSLTLDTGARVRVQLDR